jgi:FkbM family methyltransferase
MPSLSRIAPTTLLGALLRAPLRLIPKATVLPVCSGVNKGMRWIVGSSVHGCWLGHYEKEKQAAVRRLVRPGIKIFDIGANAGFYTLAFSRLVGKTGHVWAFEPLPENIRNLRRHLALNALPNVTVVEAAVSRQSGTARFLQARSNSMGRLAEHGGMNVQTVTIDDICRDTGCPDVVKLDVEGAEAAVLEGARGTLARHRPAILLATHGREQERLCAETLQAFGYTFAYLDGTPAARGGFTSDELVATPAGDA